MSNTATTNSNIETQLSAAAKELFPTLDHLKEVTSTNDYLLKLSQATTDNVICTTEHQTEGRGRRGQEWISQPGDICFSLLWQTDIDLDKLAGISLVTAIAIAAALETIDLTNNIKLKWPNDIFCNRKKLGGVLIESTRHEKKTAVIIGVGINQHSITQPSELSSSAISLSDITKHSDNQAALVAKIINQLAKYLNNFEQSGLDNFVAAWQQYDLTYQQEITVRFNQTELSGISQGINNKGELVIKTANGDLQTINSGSIRLN